MNYSFMSFSCPDASLPELLKNAKSFGYAGIEPRVEAGHIHGIELDMPAEKIQEVRDLCMEAGVEIACLATSCVLADPEKAGPQIERTASYLRLGGQIGARTLRIFGGGFPKEVTREQAMETLIASLRTLAPEAAEHGPLLCLETHDSWRDARDVKKVMEAVDHPAVGVNWDIMHPVNGNFQTVEEAYLLLKPWIRHVHVHDGGIREGKLQFLPIGTGDVDHRTAIRLLKADGYAGYLSGEWINWEPWDVHLPREISVMKSYE
ncbi:MAG TPA: hypothetical protein DD727_02340 [Clostridiales bacterium]|nr:hypothetical protein [Clostridiales bacterium]